MDILDDKFDIGEYVDDSKETVASKSIDAARKWANDAMRVIILPTNTLEELENDWIAFNSMIKKNRRESDWKSIELFDRTNQDSYEMFRAEFLHGNDDQDLDELNESYIDSSVGDDYYEVNAINYTTVEVERARKWSEESNRVIILPTRTLPELEQLWDSYQAMVLKHRRESDWMSTELFGVTNLKHYEYLKNQFLREDISKEDLDKYGSVVEHTTCTDLSKYICELCNTSPNEAITQMLEISMRNNSLYEDRLISNVIDDAIDELDKSSTVTFSNHTPSDMPYFSPEDMIDMGIHSANPEDNYFGALADIDSIGDTPIEEWFEMYKNASEGYYTEFYKMTPQWVNTVRTLMEGLKSIEDEYDINARKQSILELGWNPNIEFTNRSRKIANECAAARMNKNISSKVIDLREFRTGTSENLQLNESISASQLRPLFVAISATRTQYNISISFDSSLDTMYTTEKLSIISRPIKDMDKNTKFDLFAVFFEKDEYNKIRNYIEYARNSKNKLIDGIFNIPITDSDTRKVCAEFVYRFTNHYNIVINCNLVKEADNKGRIYILYSGTAYKYDKNRTSIIMNSINRTARISESSSEMFSESGFINSSINYIKSDITRLIELEQSINCVTNKTAKKLLESTFDNLTAKPYRAYTGKNPTLPTMDFVNELISDNFSVVL